MTLAEREATPVARLNGWPPTAQFAFRGTDGKLVYYKSNPRAKTATRISDGIIRSSISR